MMSRLQLQIKWKFFSTIIQKIMHEHSRFKFSAIMLFREQSLSMTGRGGGKNLNFSAKYFVPHEGKMLYFHAPVSIFDFVSYPSFCQRSLYNDNFMYMYNLMMS